MTLRPPVRPPARDRRGLVLVIVLWIAFGLVSLALYFGNSTALELRAAENRAAGLEAGQAIEGAARYAAYLFAHTNEPGRLPDIAAYQRDAVPVGAATFWFLGRDPQRSASGSTGASASAAAQPYFALTDEAAKLNLNTATLEMLEALPRMTPEFAAAIIDWRDADSDVTTGGAEDDTYMRFSPAYHCKNGKFETIDELRLVSGADLELLFGEDTNLNGVLDPNENDGTGSLPLDNRDGRLDPGILEYVTVYSRESNTTTNGTARINLSQPGASANLGRVLATVFGQNRANAISRQLGPPNATFRSPLEFFLRSGLTAEEFAQIEDQLTVATGDYAEGLVNVSAAGETVLACLPGIGTDKAPAVVAYRLANPDKLGSVAWVAEVLDRAGAIQAGPYITAHSYQFSADVAAVGRLGRGYRRTRLVFDLTGGTPAVVRRQDLTHLGWALGRDVRLRQEQWLTGNMR